MLCRSALLQRCKRPGLGLYLALRVERDAVIGHYEGVRVGTFACYRSALRFAQARQLFLQSHDKLITRTLLSGGMELLDGETGGGPMLQMINDPIGTRLQANTALKPNGCVAVLQSAILGPGGQHLE